MAFAIWCRVDGFPNRRQVKQFPRMKVRCTGPKLFAETCSHLRDIVVTAQHQTVQIEPSKAMSFRLSTEGLGCVSDPHASPDNGFQDRRGAMSTVSGCQPPPDLCLNKVTTLSIITTYKTAGTAKLRGSPARHYTLWVGVWVGKASRPLRIWSLFKHAGAERTGRTTAFTGQSTRRQSGKASIYCFMRRIFILA